MQREINNYLSIILKNINMLMGVAILLVIYFHILPGIERFITPFAFGGVDVFLFLSGIGVYLSLHKDFDILNFYKKRALRIFPAFIIVITVIACIPALNILYLNM